MDETARWKAGSIILCCVLECIRYTPVENMAVPKLELYGLPT